MLQFIYGSKQREFVEFRHLWKAEIISDGYFVSSIYKLQYQDWDCSATSTFHLRADGSVFQLHLGGIRPQKVIFDGHTVKWMMKFPRNVEKAILAWRVLASKYLQPKLLKPIIGMIAEYIYRTRYDDSVWFSMEN